MIKTGINFSGLIGPELIRLITNHPDIDLRWVAGPGLPADGIAGVFDELQGEVREVSALPDFDAIDLYIGHDLPDLHAFLDTHTSAKGIILGPTLNPGGYEDAVLGVCEYNRKALVRGARLAVQPDMFTLLGAIALMPLAKNLLLNSPVSGTMIVPATSYSKGISMPAATLSPLIFKKLRTDILEHLQTSFEAPMEINAIEIARSSFAGAVLTVDNKMGLDDVRSLYEDFYGDHRHIVFPTHAVNEAMVLNTNKTVIGLGKDSLGRLIITVAFDARYKESGNVIHTLNLLFGLDELTGF